MTLPLLPRDANYVRTALVESPQSTQEALLTIFHTTMNASLYSGVSNSDADEAMKQAWQAYRHTHWMDQSNLVQLQTLLFLVLESSNRGSLVINGGHGSSPWDYLNQAVAKCKTITSLSFAYAPWFPDGENNMPYRTARSALFSVLILNSFMAFSNKRQGSALGKTFLTIVDRDVDIVGQRTYRLARMSHILQRVAAIRITNPESDSLLPAPLRNGSDPPKQIKISHTDIDLLEHLKEADVALLQVYLPPADPILQLAFWYTRLAIETSYYPLATSKSLLYPSRKIVEFLLQLSRSGTLANISPLVHHFAGLVTHVLLQLCEFGDTRDEANQHLEVLESALLRLVPAYDAVSFEAGIRDVVVRRQAALMGESKTAGLRYVDHKGASDGGFGIKSDAGNGGVGDREESSSEDTLQAAAEAAARAAQAMASSFRGAMLSREGYLTALLVHEN